MRKFSFQYVGMQIFYISYKLAMSVTIQYSPHKHNA